MSTDLPIPSSLDWIQRTAQHTAQSAGMIIPGNQYWVQYTVLPPERVRKHVRRHWPRKAARRLLRGFTRAQTMNFPFHLLAFVDGYDPIDDLTITCAVPKHMLPTGPT